MLLTLFEAIFFIMTLLVKVVFFILNTIIKLLIILLTNSVLRFPFILFMLGYFLHINLKILSTIYFIYLTHKFAIKFNIYRGVNKNLKKYLTSLLCEYKISKSLKDLPTDYIVLKNLTVENTNDNSCTIDYLIISKECIFTINSINYFNDTAFSFKNTNEHVINSKTINNTISEFYNTNNILSDILSSDIPIINIIVLANNNCVVEYNKNYITPIVTTESLVNFIQNSVKTNNNFNTSYTKNIILENKSWILDKALSKTSLFLSTNKRILGFFVIDLILYYLYINLIIIISN